VLYKKIILVTGATSGIGVAICKALASKDVLILAHYHQSHKTISSIEKSVLEYGGGFDSYQADFSDQDSVENLISYVENTYGRLDCLVNNAACNAQDGNGALEEMSLLTFDRLAKVNFYATFMLCKAGVKMMKKVNKGVIVNITSEAAKFGGRNIAAYASTKAAINTLTIALAREVSKYGIRVNAVSPGVIETDAQSIRFKNKTDIDNLISSIPMGRMGLPHEVADVVRWLASEKSSYINGSIVSVTGGR
jgi:NAD(P)-dependent dehydrogenase (short-subunit alcohol dehydrogenase family)